MYSCIGSYLCRAWRLFDFRFSNHPRRRSLIALSVAIYLNFFTHHFMADLRWLLFAAAAWLLGRTTVHFKVWRDHRAMPLLLGLVLVSVFIWLSENIGTFTKIWLYPSQRLGWSMVSFDKLGSWFLLLITNAWTCVRPASARNSIACRIVGIPDREERNRGRSDLDRTWRRCHRGKPRKIVIWTELQSRSIQLHAGALQIIRRQRVTLAGRGQS
jgi:hypothetical protein